MNRIRIFNGRIVTPYRIIENGCILVENGRLSYIGSEVISCDDCIDIDAKGQYVSPGFIDIHCHGGGGHDFMDGTIGAYVGALEKHAQFGTTSIVPTTLTSTNEELKNTFQVYKSVKQTSHKGAKMLGLHLEGPYFSMEQKGAQDPKYIRNPLPDEYTEILSWSNDIIRWSSAPELDGAFEFGRLLKEKGILSFIAHSDAIYEQVEKAFENGYTHITHLYSGMSGVKRINAYRYCGVIESAYIIDEMTVEVIADGSHLPPSLLKMIYKIKGPDKIALVTDSMRAAGMPEGESTLGSVESGQKVFVEDGVAKMPDRSVFAGSVATADRLVRTMVKKVGIPIPEAVRMMTSTPARILKVKDIGVLAPGSVADIVIFDEEISIKVVIIDGVIVRNLL